MVTRTGLLGWARQCLGLALAAALGLGAATGEAQASANLTFTLTPQSNAGLISYAGGDAPLVGSNLSVSSVTGLSTALHPNGALTLDSTGSLNFTTGNYTSSPTTNEIDFNSGGSISITGGIAALGIAPGTTLLTGSFTGDSFVKSLGTNDLDVQGGAFINVVNPTLAAYFGLPVGSTVYSGGLATLFEAPSTANGGFASVDLSSGSVSTAPVPEPTTFAVFAIMAGGGLLYAQRRAR